LIQSDCRFQNTFSIGNNENTYFIGLQISQRDMDDFSTKHLSRHRMVKESNIKDTKGTGNVVHEKENVKELCLPPHNLRGRPAFSIYHVAPRISLFSHLNCDINLRGFLNLICIVLVAQNARLVIENLLKYGMWVTLHNDLFKKTFS
jgi:hypothetical protein